MNSFTIGSLFDGSGGFPRAASKCGGVPVWASEIEPYPIAVTKSRFPQMIHLGDISKINGAEIEPVDVITFGSPCQDMSVAGKRVGLLHKDNGDEETTRSGLFMEAVRIIREMKEATHGIYPRYAIWENVPGAFSSNRGADFHRVLTEFVKLADGKTADDAVSVPEYGKWQLAGEIVGDGWSIAWRTLDARYWGVPQRRRRIYLVADFGDERAGKILFERESLRGDFATCRTPWQGAAADAERSTGAADQEGANCVGFLRQLGGVEAHENLAPTLMAAAGESGNNKPCVAYSFDSLASNSMKSKNPHSGCRQVEVAKTLDTTDPNPCKNQGGIAIVCVATQQGGAEIRTDDHENRVTDYTAEVREPVYCLQGNGIDRADTAGCNGKGVKEDVCYTLNTIDRPAVAYLASGKDTIGTLMANAGTKLWLGNQEAFSGDYHVIENTPVRYIVRRLTPTECARLQGFPDNWGHPDHKDALTNDEYAFWMGVRNTHAAINGKQEKQYTREQMLRWYNGLHTDSAEYKMWGNGIALPPALYCMQGIAEALGVTE